MLLVLDVRLDDISADEVCRALREEFGEGLGIVLVSDDGSRSSGRAARSEQLAGVRALARRAGAYEHLKAPALRTGLTRRELEVLHLLADGHDQHAIARRLVVSPKTVGKHIERILTKLPARSRAEAVAIAYRRGLHRPSGRPDSRQREPGVDRGSRGRPEWIRRG
jgi:DNA-binding CsgD family transcriptional regulator